MSFSGSVRVDDRFADVSIDSKETVWRGGRYAYALSPRWAFGASAFWSHRELKHRESWILASGVQARDYVDSQGNTQNAFLTDDLRGDLRQVKLTSEAAVLRFGVRCDVTEHWRLGVMIQPPGIQISTNATVSQQRLTFGVDEPDAPLPTYFRSSQSAAADSPIPWELRIGAAYLIEDWTAALDLMLHDPAGSASDPVVAIGAPAEDPYFGRAPAMPLLLPGPVCPEARAG